MQNILKKVEIREDLRIGVFVLSQDGYFSQVSRSLAGLLGYKVEQLQQFGILDIVHADDREACGLVLGQLWQREVEQCQTCLRVIGSNNCIVGLLLLSLWWLEGTDDLPPCLVCKYENIKSEIKNEIKNENIIAGDRQGKVLRNQELIERSHQERHRLLFESNPYPMWVYDTETLAILDVNAAAIAHYGYTRAEFLAMKMADLSYPECPDDHNQVFAGISGQNVHNYFTRHGRKTQSPIYVEITLLSTSFKGRAAEMVLVRDITNQKLTEEALRQAEEKYRSIFENAIEGIFQTSMDGRYLTANPMLARIYGYDSPAELMASVTNIATQLYVDPAQRWKFMGQLQAQDAVWRFESQIYRKDGSQIWISENARAIRDRSGKLQGYEGTVEDITEYKRVEEKLRLLQTLTLAIGESKDFHAALGIALQQLCQTTGWIFGEAWIPNGNGTLLECCPTWFSGDQQLLEFRRLSLGMLLPPQVGIPGRVWASKQSEWQPDVSNEMDTGFLRQKTAFRFGLKAALGVPILADNQVVAVMVFFMRRSRPEDKCMVNLVSTVAAQLGKVIQHKRAEEALRQSEERFRLTIDNAPIGMAILSLEGKFLRVNQMMCEIVGYSADELLSMQAQDITHPIDLAQDLEMKRRLLAKEISRFQMGKRYVHKNGRIVDVMLNASLVSDSQGLPMHMIKQVEDVTERKRAEARIEHLAFHDSLTDLPNRALFKDRLIQALEIAKNRQELRHSQAPLLAVLFLDLDRFKLVNDTLGHSVGDRLLQDVTRRLKHCIRKTDTLARLGGDEFMILLPEISATDNAIAVTQKILKGLEPLFHIDDQEIHITTSIGISFYPQDGTDAETLLKNADNAMYLAKDRGRNHYQVYTCSMNAKVSERLTLEKGIRRALAQNEFRVYYQPQVDLQTGLIIGMEALVRWQHPELGLVPPADFIPIAEEYGLIVPMGDWILRTACLQNKSWQDAGLPPIPIAINFSVRQFQEPNLAAKISQVLTDLDLDPRYLELEITESLVMKDEIAAIAVLHQLREAGVRISIDDFGTGYSSLSQLKRFPVEKIKIDASFIREITTDSDDAAITTAIIAMAHSLSLRAVAEGVEKVEQMEFLRSLKCDAMQGYLFSRALPAPDATALLFDQRHFL